MFHECGVLRRFRNKIEVLACHAVILKSHTAIKSLLIKPRLLVVLVIERRGLESSKCFVDTCLKQKNDLREIKLCISLSTVLQLEASTY